MDFSSQKCPMAFSMDFLGFLGYINHHQPFQMLCRCRTWPTGHLLLTRAQRHLRPGFGRSKMVSPKKNTAKAPVNSGQFIVNFDPFGIESPAEKKQKKSGPDESAFPRTWAVLPHRQQCSKHAVNKTNT
jgi:hypothetical protein